MTGSRFAFMGVLVLAGLASDAALSQQVQKPAIWFSGSNEQHGADFTRAIERRLSVVFDVNADRRRPWGVSIHVLNPYQTPIIYSMTLLDNCGERWCWRTTYTGTCRTNELNNCADRIFNTVVNHANSN